MVAWKLAFVVGWEKVGLVRKGEKLADELKLEKMGGDTGLAGEDAGDDDAGGGDETPGRDPAVLGNNEELNISPGGEEETDGGEGDIPHEGLDCLSFCRRLQNQTLTTSFSRLRVSDTI